MVIDESVGTPPLALRDVAVGYRGRTVVEGLTLEVSAGEIVVLVGPNGVGKTSILRAASGVLAPHQGTVELAGVDFFRLSSAERARRVAVVPQVSALPATFCVEEVVALGRTPHLSFWGRESTADRDAVERSLMAVGLAGFGERFVDELSGGERQRMVIARALAQEAGVLLLDEATVHLDWKYAIDLLTLVRKLAHERGLAVLATTHDLNQASLHADRIGLLADGRLHALGPPAAVLTPAKIERTFGVRFQVVASGGDRPLVVPATGDDPA